MPMCLCACPALCLSNNPRLPDKNALINQDWYYVIGLFEGIEKRTNCKAGFESRKNQRSSLIIR